MSDYSSDVVREAFPYIFLSNAGSGMVKREPGMPSGGGDPRNANMSEVIVIDVRWAWETCEWITPSGESHAADGLPLVPRESAQMLGLGRVSYLDEVTVGFRELANWLNATAQQRASRFVSP